MGWGGGGSDDEGRTEMIVEMLLPDGSVYRLRSKMVLRSYFLLARAKERERKKMMILYYARIKI